MIITKPERNSTYVPAPAGVHQAVLVDIVDLGLQESEWEGKKSMKQVCRLVFQIDELNAERNPPERFTVGKRFNASLDNRSKLYAFLKQWGKLPSQKELESSWETDALIGQNAMISIEHENGKGPNADKIYASIASIVPVGPKAAKIKPEGYVRVKDRPPKTN